MTQESVRHDDAQYRQFATDLYAQVRAEAFGEDMQVAARLAAERWLSRCAFRAVRR